MDKVTFSVCVCILRYNDGYIVEATYAEKFKKEFFLRGFVFKETFV